MTASLAAVPASSSLLRLFPVTMTTRAGSGFCALLHHLLPAHSPKQEQ